MSSLLLVGSSWMWSPAGQAGQAHTGRHEEAVLCTGTSESTYDPPLTLTPHETHVRIKARYACTVGPGPATGSLEGVSPEASCLGLANPHITETVKYADGRRSLIRYDSGTTVRATDVQIVTLSGRVTEGLGKGQAARRTVAALSGQLPTNCLSSGLTMSSGGAQLEIRP
ncbi:hypothetical protein [Streptomyces sp. ISL-11]|uniref:hypothetical protein n=1 Tax=Streptomyces sp. ISL-11 TaxID=2819174 RepID=UPI001BE544C0|nr:hypothetical protein [Streptomyces sp. ISL-11]MBT2383609.1 hypothetical protein [Streptomyces sp. ISL-11]